jgi:hypothetical protein
MWRRWWSRTKTLSTLGSSGQTEKVPNGYCPNHATGVRLPDDFVAMPLQYVK